MKTISVREMKAHWAQVERQVRNGDTSEVLNRGRLSVRVVPARPRPVLIRDNHRATAIRVPGKSGEATVKHDREGRW